MIVSNLKYLIVIVSFSGFFYCLDGTRKIIWRALGYGDIDSSHSHEEGKLPPPPSQWFVNLTYHLRHHLEFGGSYFSGVIPIFDKILGTAVNYEHRTFAITGADGVFGRALIAYLVARKIKTIALTTRHNSSLTKEYDSKYIKVVVWKVGNYAAVKDALSEAHILICNHGIKPERFDSQSMGRAFEINVESHMVLAEIFFETIKTSLDVATKELWINTSCAEVIPVKSNTYELTKKQLGFAFSLIRLEAPCIVRKLILEGFRSPLSPNVTIEAADIVPKLMNNARRDRRNIVISRNPLVHLLVIVKETLIYWLYRKSPVKSN